MTKYVFSTTEWAVPCCFIWHRKWTTALWFDLITSI